MSFNVVPKLSHIVVLLKNHFGDLRPPLSGTMIEKFTLFFSDFKRVFVSYFTGKILSFEFHPKAAFFEGKFRISRSAVVHVQK